MGISGLLPLLKPATRPVNVKEFSGCTVAIDVYCWLHKGAFGCAEQLARGQYTDGYVKYVMKYINMLLYHNIKPILVFDGRNLPSKRETERKRRTARKENRERAVQLLKEGKGNEAREYFQRCVDITPAMARDVIAAARERNIDCIVAPYEADAQLAFLNMCGLAQMVITEDSDLTLFGCDQILFKLKETGEAVYYSRSELGKAFGLCANSFSFEKFRYMCIMAGCDYLSNLPGVGLIKSKNFWKKVTNPDLNNVLRKIPAYLNMPNLVVSQEYISKFEQANQTFLHQLVFDPVRREEVPLTPLPSSLGGQLPSFCGTHSPPVTALQLALGNLDLHSLDQVTSYNPDFPGSDKNTKPKYGSRTDHPSVWTSRASSSKTTQGFFSKTSPTKKPCPVTSSIPLSSVVSTPPVKNKKVVPVIIRQEKRKSEKVVITEEDITDLLNQDCSPLPKRGKLQDDFVHASSKAVSDKKLERMLGETKSQPGRVTVSKYFASSSTPKKEVSDEVINKRSAVTEESSGNWFEGLEKSANLEGRFIYRPKLDDITNSADSASLLEGKTNTPRRNPFKIMQKSDPINKSPSEECVDKESPKKTVEVPDVVNGNLFKDSLSSDSGVSSQESSSSQHSGVVNDVDSSQECKERFGSQDTLPCLNKEHISKSVSPPSVRLGLSKFSFKGNTNRSSPLWTKPEISVPSLSSSTPSTNLVGAPKPVSKLGPARVSGLSKTSRPPSTMKQGSLLSMFSRTVKKADFGPS